MLHGSAGFAIGTPDQGFREVPEPCAEPHLRMLVGALVAPAARDTTVWLTLVELCSIASEGWR